MPSRAGMCVKVLLNLGSLGRACEFLGGTEVHSGHADEREEREGKWGATTKSSSKASRCWAGRWEGGETARAPK